MCGRFALTISPEVLARLFQLAEVPTLEARYNIAPSQPIAVLTEKSDEPGRVLRMLRWGLIPSWAKEPAMGARLINARSETAAEKPAFREAFRNRRCLIPADGFYEWQKRGGTKQPLFFRNRDATPLALAGLWERWVGPEGSVIESCTILTTPCNELMRPVHDRMPVIIEPQDYQLWLDVSVRRAELLERLLRPYSSEKLMCYPVGPAVNSPKNDHPGCLEPLKQGGELEKGLFDD